MDDLARQFQRKLEVFCDVRGEVTGVALHAPDPAEWQIDRLKDLVSAVYKLLREDWRDEIEYVARIASIEVTREKALTRYLLTIRDLRQSAEHSDTPDADHALRMWLKEAVGTSTLDASNEGDACRYVLQQGVEALSALVGLAKQAQKDYQTSTQWSSFVADADSFDLTTELLVVAGDLGAGPFGKRFEGELTRRLQRGWNWRAKELTASDDRRRALETEILRVLASELLGSIPCSYVDVLEALDLDPGTEEALGAVLIAHGAARLADYDDTETFLDLVRASTTSLGTL